MVTAGVIRRSKSKGAALIILAYLSAVAAESKRRGVYISLKEIALDCNLAENSVNRAVKQLEESGEVVVKRSLVGGPGARNHYEIAV